MEKREFWINNNVCLGLNRFGNFGFGFFIGGHFIELTMCWFQLWVEW